MQQALNTELTNLRNALNKHTKETYNRINPFNENLIDWKENGKQISGNENTTIYESSTVIGDVIIGENCWIGPFTILDGGGGLTVGNMVTLSAGVMVYTHDTLMHTLSEGKMPYEYAPVTIEDYCFVGTQSIILKGAYIGRNSLVAANSVVSGRVEPYSIVAGSPARKIGFVQANEDGTVTLNYQEKE